MLPHEYYEFRLFAEGSVIPPEHRLILVNFHRECIGDAKKAQWDRGIRSTSKFPMKLLIMSGVTLGGSMKYPVPEFCGLHSVITDNPKMEMNMNTLQKLL